MKRALAVVFAALLITGAVGGVVNSDELDPIEEAEALALTTAAAYTGVALVAGGTGISIGAMFAPRDAGETEETIQRKIDFYQSAVQQRANIKAATSIAENGVRSTDPKMQMEGIARLRTAALQEDRSLAGAKTAVSRTLNNRTSIKQINTANAWSASALTVQYIENVTDGAPNIDDGFASPAFQTTDLVGVGESAPENPDYDITINDSVENWNKTVTLANGTETTITAIPLTIIEGGSRDGYTGYNDETAQRWLNPATNDGTFTLTFQSTDTSMSSTGDYEVTFDVSGYSVTRNQSSDADSVLDRSGDVVFADVQEWRTVWSDIDAQNNEVIQTVHDIADTDYAAIKAGDIDLPTTNPYYVSEQRAPTGQEGEAFVADWMSSIGASNPEDWQNVSTTKVVLANGTTYYGQLLGAGLEDGITFRENVTYDSSNITGSPYMITQQGKVPLNGNWTLDEVEGLGTNKSSLTFETKDLDASTISGYREAVEWMKKQQAESEERERKDEEGGPIFGGLLDALDLIPGIPPIGEIAIIGGGGLLAFRFAGGS